MNKKNNHCCALMEQFIKDDRVTINYEAVLRRYSLYLFNSILIQGIDYCPWCGVKLPMPLLDTYFKVLKKEYGLDDPNSKEQEKHIPEEFKSDAWWKKRKL